MSPRSKLRSLRARLGALRLLRRAARWGAAACGLLVALLAFLAGAFAVDFALELTRPQRAVLLAVLAGGVLWAFRRFARPWLGREGSIFAAALRVEREHGIDSDLVAALQFESAEASRWGSRDLEDAVVERVAAASRRLGVFRGFRWDPLPRRGAALAVLAAAAAGLGVRFPAHLDAFVERMLLGSRRYPTRTVIERVAANSMPLHPPAPGAKPPAAASGKPLALEVLVSGEVPARASAEVVEERSGERVVLDLAPGALPGTFAGELPRLREPVAVAVRAGDDRTEPVRVAVVPLPAVEVELRAAPPAYARARAAQPGAGPGSRHLSVLEGSRVSLHVVCSNKRLVQAAVRIGEVDRALRPEGAGGGAWALDPAGTPLERVAAPVCWAVRVVDEDGLELDGPLEGTIRVEPDPPPRVAAAMRTPFVLPAARPGIAYGAADENGIARVLLRVRIERADGRTEERELPVADFSREAGPPPAAVRDRCVLDLAPLGLAKGDKVRLAVEAVDHRGPAEGQRGSSDPLVLEVTDERGILAALADADERSAKELDRIIERQLGIGGR
ncbi:MAG: hypothetical protein HY721_20340 [Planctomycetes bacterium]|nr:hypothetical protein [Planctomycetota bacterium]